MGGGGGLRLLKRTAKGGEALVGCDCVAGCGGLYAVLVGGWVKSV